MILDCDHLADGYLEEDEDDYDEEEVYRGPGFEGIALNRLPNILQRGFNHVPDEESEAAPFAWGWPPQHGRYAAHNHEFGNFMRGQGEYKISTES